MSLKQKLANILESFADKSENKDIWGDAPEGESHPANLTLHLDTEHNNVGVYSDDVDAKGRPVQQWEMNTKSGHITETTRTRDGGEVQITQRDVDVTTLNKEQNDKMVQRDSEDTHEWIAKLEAKSDHSAGSAEEAASSSNDVVDEWQDLEKQRDIAFKIMYFFIVFIIATFSLLYAFFRMTQNSEQEAAMRKGIAKGERVRDQQQTFLDFLAGQMEDENYVVNPYARKNPTAVTSQFTSASTPFANLAAQGYTMTQQMAARKGKAASEDSQHRANSGFGANNLVHLANEERGRFDDLEVDGDRKPDFSKLAGTF